MSCVAEANAISQNSTNVHLKKSGSGSVSATPARAAPKTNCMVVIHQRLVRSKSTIGLQMGLITHGRYSQLV